MELPPNFLTFRKVFNMSDKPAEAKSRSRNVSREFALVLMLSVLLLLTLL
jgi:hypothetical protein